MNPRTAVGQALAATCCRRSAFTSFRISFMSSRSSSIRLLTLASLAFTSYQISPNRAVKKPDGNHSISPGGIAGMGSTAQSAAISLLYRAWRCRWLWHVPVRGRSGRFRAVSMGRLAALPPCLPCRPSVSGSPLVLSLALACSCSGCCAQASRQWRPGYGTT